MGDWLTQLKSKTVDLLHCDDASEEGKTEECKAVSSLSPAYGFGLIAGAYTAYFQFPPAKLLDQDQPSSKWTLTWYANSGACTITVMLGTSLLAYHALYAGPSPKATKNKKWISCMGIFWLVIALISRAFLAMPAGSIAPVSGAVLVGTAGTVLVWYVCSGESESPEKTQADSNGRV